jgi:hypothetical protein
MKNLLYYIQKQKKYISKLLLRIASANFADMYYVVDALRHKLPGAKELSKTYNEALAPVKYWHELYEVLEKVEKTILDRGNSADK